MNVSDVDACALPEPHLTLPSAAAALTTGAAILGVALQDDDFDLPRPTIFFAINVTFHN